MRFPVLIDNSGQRAKWKLLMTEITRKYQEKVESRKTAKKVRKEAAEKQRLQQWIP